MAAQFLTGNELNHELEKIFENATKRLVLISPYISLHERYTSVLRSKLADDKLAISLVFGKNEDNPKRSMSRDELVFFMQFPNIEIKHEPRLHAKYYASDGVAIVTSMNLYRYSQDHNIEAGVKMETTSLEGELANRLIGRSDMEATAYNYFDRVIDQATLIYRKEPEYEKVMFGLSKKYLGSKVTTDKVDEFFAGKPMPARPKPAAPPNPQPHQPTVQPVVVATRPQWAAPVPGMPGYCIRTGTPIPFNVKRPLSDEAYKSWSRYKDDSYAEKFCHFSGEPSHGDTSVAKPILKKNWSKAKAAFDL